MKRGQREATPSKTRFLMLDPESAITSNDRMRPSIIMDSWTIPDTHKDEGGPNPWFFRPLRVAATMSVCHTRKGSLGSLSAGCCLFLLGWCWCWCCCCCWVRAAGASCPGKLSTSTLPDPTRLFAAHPQIHNWHHLHLSYPSTSSSLFAHHLTICTFPPLYLRFLRRQLLLPQLPRCIDICPPLNSLIY